MTWLFNILIVVGATALTLSVISFLLHFVFVGWRKDLLKWGKALFIIGAVLVIVPSGAKPLVGWLTRGPTAEQVAEQEAAAKLVADRKAAQEREEAANLARDRQVIESQRQQAAALAARNQPPAPVRPVAAPRVWIVPSGSAGFFMSSQGVIDGSRAYLPGSHPQRPGGRVFLVNIEPEIILFNQAVGEDAATISATSRDNEVTNVTVAITWLVVPENVALFKSKMGQRTLYTPIFYDIARGSVRTSISRFDWSPATNATSVMNRQAFARDIQAELERHTEAHFRRLGFGDQSGNIIRFGEVSLRQITHDR
jgi:hypothetical protein